MSDVYLAEPPAGEVRSLTDPPSRFHNLLAVAVATTVIAAVAVCVRFYTRIHIVGGRISLDDCEQVIDPIYLPWHADVSGSFGRSFTSYSYYVNCNKFQT